MCYECTKNEIIEPKCSIFNTHLRLTALLKMEKPRPEFSGQGQTPKPKPIFLTDSRGNSYVSLVNFYGCFQRFLFVFWNCDHQNSIHIGGRNFSSINIFRKSE